MLIGTKLLYSDYDHDGKTYDIYGLPPTEIDDCVIDAVCIAGSKVNVMYLLGDSEIKRMEFWMNAGLYREWMAERDELRINRAIQDREMALTDHQWRSL